MDSNIHSNISNKLRDLYEKSYYSFDSLMINSNISNQLLFKAYLYYKKVQEGKEQLADYEDIKFFTNFIDIKNDISLNEKYNLYKEFIPKLFLVCYYYLSYFYSTPFKMPIDQVKKNIEISNENDKYKLYISLGNIINDCYKKIVKGESILTKNIVNEFHKILIKVIIIEEGKINLHKYLECLSDFDFCLELIFDILDEKGNNKISNEIIQNMMINDRRLGLMPYYYDIDEFNKTKILDKTELNEGQINKWDEGVKIKNILVVYNDKSFFNLIKSIELPLKIRYIKKEELDKFFMNEEKDENNFRIMKYYIITDIKTADELFNTFNFYIYNYGLTLVFIIYCHSDSLISKLLLLSGQKLSCICVYSKESIKEYFYDIKNVYKSPLALCLNEFKGFINETNESNKSIFTPMEEIEESDNGWDIIKEINPCIFISNYIIRNSNLVVLWNFIISVYELYKEKEGLELYFKKYNKYFGATSCFEEQLNTTSFIKQVIYAYTREEGKNRNGEKLSFYCLINNDFFQEILKKLKDIYV